MYNIQVYGLHKPKTVWKKPDPIIWFHLYKAQKIAKINILFLDLGAGSMAVEGQIVCFWNLRRWIGITVLSKQEQNIFWITPNQLNFYKLVFLRAHITFCIVDWLNLLDYLECLKAKRKTQSKGPNGSSTRKEMKQKCL